MMIFTAILAAAGTALMPQTSETIGPHLAEIREFAGSEGEQLWPGYGTAPFGFLLVTESTESLFCRDVVPAGFTPAGLEPATGCIRHTRPRSKLPANWLAALPLFGPPAVIVMGTPEATGRTQGSWVRTILHEHFHQWQYALPSYFERTKGLGLHDGDETGMWVLNYPFPYDEPEVVRAFEDASGRLADAVTARGSPVFLPAFDRYLAARKVLAEQAGERNWRYLDFQLWQEGVARWTEIELGKAYEREDVRAAAAKLEQSTIEALRTSALPELKREVVYAHGAAEAMLLEACGPEWRRAYPQSLALGDLLQFSRAHCLEP